MTGAFEKAKGGFDPDRSGPPKAPAQKRDFPVAHGFGKMLFSFLSKGPCHFLSRTDTASDIRK